MIKQLRNWLIIAIPIASFLVFEVVNELFEDNSYYEDANNSSIGDTDLAIPYYLLLFTIIGFAIAAFFGYRYYQSLQISLDDQKQQADQQKQRADKLNGNLGDYVANQFEQWKLSNSEREIALFIIKGLPYNEIAKIRGVKEKTIRQQAANIYAKTNIKGRSEFAAWFIEDLL